MRQAQIQEENIDAILLTHGHSDHVSGVATVAARQGIPVFMNEGTREEAPALQKLRSWQSFRSEHPFQIGDLTIEAFSISHDAQEPVGFRVTCGKVRGALATDLGEITDSVSQSLNECDWLVLESNHDELMLKEGPYPWEVKQRVLGPLGHLSNQAVSSFLASGFDGQATDIFLAHLSRRNNDPEVAIGQAATTVGGRFQDRESPPRVHLTHQNKPSIVLNL